MYTVMRGGKVYIGRLKHGADLLAELTKICKEKNIFHGEVKAIGALKKARYGYYDQTTRKYEYLEFDEPSEILALVGNVSILKGKPMVHCHITIADERGNALGGHLAEGCEIFACEFTITEYITEIPLQRGPDEETGLMLWQQL